ncbi:MAG: efflux RND transporter permease subunit [Gemmatimonadaceae bacterium]|nr:efflux RND transporter permease subunit [Gemmatimonadaceae bacterium]
MRNRPGFKEFGLTTFAVANRVSVMVLLAFIGLIGLVSYHAIPREASPEVQIPIVVVSTLYPGVSPSDIETLVTRPLEEELNTISEIKVLSSNSTEGFSSITAEFQSSVDLGQALQKVRERVDLARPKLPGDAEEPAITEINLSEFPIMQVNLSGEYGLVRLKEIAEQLQTRFEQLPQVLRADISGGLEREVKVDVDLPRLQFYGLSLQDVVDAVRGENVNVPGGSIDVGSLKYLVRVDGEFPDPSVIEDIVVKTFAGRPVYVRDVATVEFGFSERTSFARLDGTPVVTIDIVKRSGQNIIQTSQAVRDIIAQTEAQFPPTTVVKITSDQSEEIHEMVSSLENNIISGLLLIVGVLLFFLGLRNSAFVAVSIPASMLLAFMLLGVMGITLNMVVLFSLILALGMLVDNAIVVVENIYRYMEEGWDRTQAAVKATGEVALPIIAATATTVAAFAPLMFWPGIVGDFMKYLPLTLIVTLSSSLFVALVIVPTLCAMFMRIEGGPPAPVSRATRLTIAGVAGLILLVVLVNNPLSAALLAGTAVALYFLHTRFLAAFADRFQHRFIPTVVRDYEKRLRWSLAHRGVIVGASVASLIATFVAFGFFNNGVEFFPESIPPAQAAVTIEAPKGTRAEVVDGMARQIEGELASIPGIEDVESAVTTVGGSGGNMFAGGNSGAHTGRVTVSFVDFNDRQHDAFVTLRHMQERLGRGIAGANLSVEKPPNGPPSGAPVNIEIAGADPLVLKQLADGVLSTLRNARVYGKLEGLESDLDDARPELFVRVDREKAGLYELTTGKVGGAIRGAIQGVEAAKFRTGKEEYDIIVRLAPQYREDLASLRELNVMAEGTQIPLSSVAEWEVRDGLGSINRKDLDRVATVSSDVRSGLNTNAVLAEVQQVLQPFVDREMPPGYTLRYTGQSEDQTEAQAFLMMAFGLAIALIAFILISQFNSVIKPMIILSSVMLSTMGVFVGLMVFDMPFVIIMTGVGIISLAGIVVNNAIVLIDYIEILKTRDGLGTQDALVRAGMTRFRPVVLTALTTALGLIPLAIGLNFDFIGLFTRLNPELYWGGEQAAWWGPMAVAVIVGISVATFLTLIVVPVLYSLFDDMTARVTRLYTPVEVLEPGVKTRVTGGSLRQADEPAGVMG